VFVGKARPGQAEEDQQHRENVLGRNPAPTLTQTMKNIFE
jgi:hypothetical protein